MSLWKRHTLTLMTLSTAVIIGTTDASADTSRMQPVNPGTRIISPNAIAHVLKPGMLAKIPSNAVGSKLITVKGAEVRVNQEQLDAYAKLPEDLKGKLGVPVDGSVLSAKQIEDLSKRAYSTVMCPW